VFGHGMGLIAESDRVASAKAFGALAATTKAASAIISESQFP